MHIIEDNNKETRHTTSHQASAQTTVWRDVCPANRELIVTGYIGLTQLAWVMFGSFQATDTSNPTYETNIN